MAAKPPAKHVAIDQGPIIPGSRSEIPQLHNRCEIRDNKLVTIDDSTVTLVFLHHIFMDLACFTLLTSDQLSLPITAKLSMLVDAGTRNQFQIVSVMIRRCIGLEPRA